MDEQRIPTGAFLASMNVYNSWVEQIIQYYPDRIHPCPDGLAESYIEYTKTMTETASCKLPFCLVLHLELGKWLLLQKRVIGSTVDLQNMVSSLVA